MATVPGLPRLGAPESNPLRASTPDGIQNVDSILHDYLREQAEILREQHNKSQAGDSTFSWEWLTFLTNKQDFTLGSCGRFVHPTYGMILARYVQIGDMAANCGSPVGTQIDGDNVWVVTDQLSKSDPEMVLGIGAWRDVPLKGQFGWVIYSGVTVNQLKFVGGEPERFTKFGWDSDGQVSYEAEGIALGAVISTPTELATDTWAIPPGGAIIRLDGPSSGLIYSRFAPFFQALQADVDSINLSLGSAESALAALTLRVDGNDAAIFNLNLKVTRDIENLSTTTGRSVAQLEAAVTSERQARLDQFGAYASSQEQLLATYVTKNELTDSFTGWTETQVKALVNNEAYARATADEAIANSVSQLQASVILIGPAVTAEITAAVNAEAFVRANEDGALSSRITDIESSYVTTTVLGATVSAINADISDVYTAFATADTGLAQRITDIEVDYLVASDLTGAVTTLNGRINTEEFVRASEDGLLANRIVRLEGSYNNSETLEGGFGIYPNVTELEKDWFISGAPVGISLPGAWTPAGKVLEIAYNGNGNVLIYPYKFYPFDPGDQSVYEVEAQIYMGVGSSANVYVGLIPYDANKVNHSVTDYGSFAYVAGSRTPQNGGETVTYRGYASLTAAVGAGNNVGRPSPNIEDPGRLPLATVYVRPVVYVLGMSGIEVFDVNWIRFRRVTGETRANARITSSVNLLTNADGVLASRLDVIEGSYVTTSALNGTVTSLTGLISDEATLRFQGDDGLSNRISVIEGSYTTTTALNSLSTQVNTRIGTEESTRFNADEGLSTRIGVIEASYTTTSALTGAVNTLNSRIDFEVSTLVNADDAIASDVTNLTTTVNGHTSTLSIQGASINGILAKYGVTLDVNGHITGFVQNNNGSTGEFIVRADRFAVVDPADPLNIEPPFEIVGGVTRIRNAVIGTSNVNTENLAANALVVPASYSGSGSYTIPQGSYGQINLGGAATVTLNNDSDDPATVFLTWIIACAQASSGSDAVDFKMFRSGVGDASPIYNNIDVSGASDRPNSITLGWVDTLPANTSRTYSIYANSSDNGTTVKQCVCLAQMFKKS